MSHRLPRPHQPVRPPERVMELVVNRLSSLDPATVELLQKAAVAGPEFEFSLLRLLAADGDGGDERLLDRLSEAVDARYLVELSGTPLRYRFAHGVVRNALLETVPVSQRMRLHRLAGRGLEQLGRAGDDRNIAALAYHFSEAAALGEAERAINYCELAADVATQQLAHDEAAAWYGKALEVADAAGVSDQQRYELLLALGRAQVCAGHKEARASLFRAYRFARDRGDATHAAEAVLSLNRGFFARTGDTDFEAVEALEETLALFSDLDDGGTKAALAGRTRLRARVGGVGRPSVRAERPRAAMARRASDPRALARGARAAEHDDPRARHAERAHRELLRAAGPRRGGAGRHDPVRRRLPSRRHRVEAGDAEAANDMVELAARVAGSLHQPRFLWQARLMQTAQAVFRARSTTPSSSPTKRSTWGARAGQNADAFVFHTEQTFEIERWRGNLAEHIEELRPFAGQPAWDFGYVLTRYLYEAGDTVAASEIYRRIVATTFLPLRRDMLAAPALYNLALLATRAAYRATAEGLYTVLQPFADAFANTTVAKPVGWHYLGMLAATTGRTVAAESDLRKAIAIHDMVGAPLFRAESEVELARVLLGTGQPRRGRTTPCQCRRHGVRARRRTD